ncbi:hypothetical protein B0H16DRAFT_1702811 [Mycena metata]|uniref:Uncharacterized protein n=1 Tax=Mycena metata TaxID=1033252 RepID=A0AAD7H544_9AGAR|nr:hypothetical protein B0H16DRAFT_1702811 [Mycena metata]
MWPSPHTKKDAVHVRRREERQTRGTGGKHEARKPRRVALKKLDANSRTALGSSSTPTLTRQHPAPVPTRHSDSPRMPAKVRALPPLPPRQTPFPLSKKKKKSAKKINAAKKPPQKSAKQHSRKNHLIPHTSLLGNGVSHAHKEADDERVVRVGDGGIIEDGGIRERGGEGERGGRWGRTQEASKQAKRKWGRKEGTVKGNVGKGGVRKEGNAEKGGGGAKKWEKRTRRPHTLDALRKGLVAAAYAA